MEGALVRRGPLPLTRRRGEPGLAARRRGLRPFPRKWSRLRRRVATEGVRGHLTSSARGRQSRDREAPRGGAVDRSSARNAWRPLRCGRPGPRLRTRAGNGSCAMAEAGGSPSSDALPVDLPEVSRRKADRCSRRRFPARGAGGGGRARESDGPWRGARVRKSVAEVGETHLSSRTSGAAWRPALHRAGPSRCAGQARG